MESISKITGFKNGSRDRVRELVRIRDNHTCQICGKKWEKGNRRFDVHHLDEEHEGKDRYYSKLASGGHSIPTWDRKNMDRMITYCHKCHLSLPHLKEKMAKIAVERLKDYTNDNNFEIQKEKYNEIRNTFINLSKNNLPVSYRIVGNVFGISGQRIRQIIKRGEEKDWDGGIYA